MKRLLMTTVMVVYSVSEAPASPSKSLSADIQVPQYDEVVLPPRMPPAPVTPSPEVSVGPNHNGMDTGLGGTVPLDTLLFFMDTGGGVKRSWGVSPGSLLRQNER